MSNDEDEDEVQEHIFEMRAVIKKLPKSKAAKYSKMIRES